MSLFGFVNPAQACGCRSPSGPGSAVLAAWETWGVVATQTTRTALGAYGSTGHYSRFVTGGISTSELSVAGGYRPVSTLELAAMTGVANEQVHLPRFATRAFALADTTVRVRWEPYMELPDLPGLPKYPSLGLALSVRLPTGSLSRSGFSSGGVGSTAASQGLGTTELALAVDVRRTFSRKLQIAGVLDGGLRLPDDALGVSRTLGPRGSARALALWFVSDGVTAGASADFAVEGNVRYAGVNAPDSGQRSAGVSAFVGWKLDGGLRGAVALAYTPAIEGLGKNATSSVGLSLSIGYSK